jgi:LuxR family maltose regulon positive regulatory protein
LPDQVQSVLVLKTHPPEAPPGLVHRPGLIEQLDGAARPVTLISAGPERGSADGGGVGVIPCLRGGGWLSLDPADDDLQSFWSHLLAALLASGGVPRDSALRDIIPAH